MWIKCTITSEDTPLSDRTRFNNERIWLRLTINLRVHNHVLHYCMLQHCRAQAAITCHWYSHHAVCCPSLIRRQPAWNKQAYLSVCCSTPPPFPRGDHIEVYSFFFRIFINTRPVVYLAYDRHEPPKAHQKLYARTAVALRNCAFFFQSLSGFAK